MRVAVVGTGPSAFGVLKGLHETRPDARVDVFDAAHPADVPDPPARLLDDRARLAAFYKELRHDHGFILPPPKSHFGYAPERVAVDYKARVWKSDAFGGLSRLWGASVLPFTDRELSAWPISYADLAPYYAKVAGVIGVTGEADGLDGYFPSTFVNRPPLYVPGAVRRLADAVARKDRTSLIGGAARLAVETRPDHAGACVHCGECMIGCPLGSIFSAHEPIDAMIGRGEVHLRAGERVTRLDPKAMAVIGAGAASFGPYDRIYLAAGALGTTEILMRGFGIDNGPELVDNAVYTFPIIFTGTNPDPGEDADKLFALTNYVIGLLDAEPGVPFLQVQVYPSFSHLWRYYLPRPVWPLAEFLGRGLKRRLLWGRLYLPESGSAAYRMRMETGGGVGLTAAREHAGADTAARFIDILRDHLKGAGFWIPALGPIGHASSSHYAASLPYGNAIIPVGADGAVAPGIHVCDSSVFPTSPSISPTFTMMANAWRTATESL